MENERRWRRTSLLAIGMVVGIVMVGTPAGAHVGGTVNHLWGHLKPKTDARYLPGQNLPPGKTMRGVYMIGDTSGGGVTFGENSFSFPRPLASQPVAHYIAAGSVAPAQCPGTDDNPKAAPGHLCVYEAAKGNLGSFTILNPTTNGAGSSRWGFFVQTTAAAAGLFYSNGTWAVTAPTGSSPAPRVAPEPSRTEGAARG